VKFWERFAQNVKSEFQVRRFQTSSQTEIVISLEIWRNQIFESIGPIIPIGPIRRIGSIGAISAIGHIVRYLVGCLSSQ
jgi:hypothetical protein